MSEDLQTYFIEFTQESLTALKELIARLDDTPPDPRELNKEMHAIAHNIKGMGTSFGYPLMTEAGASLCTYLRGLGDRAADKRIVAAHHSLMQSILEQKITGDGGAREQGLIRDLKQMTSA